MKKLIFLYSILVFSEISAKANRVLLCSIPKCGTYLCAKIVNRVLKKNPRPTSSAFHLSVRDIHRFDFSHFFICQHIMPLAKNIELLKKYNIKVIFILRDPRDQTVSWMNYVKYRIKYKFTALSDLSHEELIKTWITDTSGINTGTPDWRTPLAKDLKGIDTFYNLYLPWLQMHDIAYCTTFEKLVGPQGGGDRNTQIQEVKNIAQHLDVVLTQKEAEKIADELFGESRTFFQGKTKSWQKEFTQEHKKLFKEVAGQLLIDLGYETNLDW